MRLVVLISAIVFLSSTVQAQTVFTVDLDGAQAGTGSSFTGSSTVTLNAAEDQITVEVTHNVPNANVTAGHIYEAPPGTDGPIIFPFSSGDSPVSESFAISAA